MARRHVYQRILLLTAALLVSACDPATSYVPRDWERFAESHWSKKSFGRIEVGIEDVGGLIGHSILSPQVQISNKGNSTVVVESAVLRTQKAEYAAQPPGKAEGVWATIPPDTYERFTPVWELKEPLYKALEGPFEIVLGLRVGDERTEIRIPLVKVEAKD